MLFKVLSVSATFLLVTANADFSSNASQAKFLAAFDGLSKEIASPNSSSKDMTSDAMEAAITDLMLGKTSFAGTPMGGSVKVIEDVLVKTMMPKVIAAHVSDQKNLNRLIADLHKCSTTKNGALKKSMPARNLYTKMSREHIRCRAAESVNLQSKNVCLNQQRALYNEKVLKCTFFATVSKNYGTQKANQEVMKKSRK